METAFRLGTNITMLIWEDNAYGLIAWKQQQEFGTHTDLSFTNPNWVKLAESFGWAASRCTMQKICRTISTKALQHEGPALVVIRSTITRT